MDGLISACFVIGFLLAIAAAGVSGFILVRQSGKCGFAVARRLFKLDADGTPFSVHRWRRTYLWLFTLLFPVGPAVIALAEWHLQMTSHDWFIVVLGVSLIWGSFMLVVGWIAFSGTLPPGMTQRIWLAHPGRCPVCEYDLQGITTGRCPECGWLMLPAK